MQRWGSVTFWCGSGSGPLTYWSGFGSLTTLRMQIKIFFSFNIPTDTLSGSIHLTIVSGSGRPKNMRVQIRIPKHWRNVLENVYDIQYLVGLRIYRERCVLRISISILCPWNTNCCIAQFPGIKWTSQADGTFVRSKASWKLMCCYKTVDSVMAASQTGFCSYCTRYPFIRKPIIFITWQKEFLFFINCERK